MKTLVILNYKSVYWFYMYSLLSSLRNLELDVFRRLAKVSQEHMSNIIIITFP